MSTCASRLVTRSSPTSARYSASCSGSCAYATGNSRLNPGSADASPWSAARSCGRISCSIRRSSSGSFTSKRPSRSRRTPRTFLAISPEPSGVVLHGRPEAVLVQPEHVELALLARAARHDGSTLLVHVEHQLRRLLEAVAEQLLEHEGH